ncbi:TetR/AcrR family transcriptional regulator (plasmid) [Rhizobium sp. RCAM05350]|uniref:TetR/AcrR family transcriptional regulator n=1 Tax=Rhizobium sp. RCAM05350 TaxID=2895568 RepID=UPI0020769318|nr:TetR/AcrR family transcriptional regulator [Rhizobium sp. RCAM05350]URK89392.1 TetR/AcrR family transcriptional regulator [Rhizobium sp. RCAM05350]
MLADDTEASDASLTQTTRVRILAAAANLIEKGGGDAATTRAVAAAAGVQAPTIYRLFGDKRGLLDAVALHRLNTYIEEKSSRLPDPDPIQDLRNGWDVHVEFCLAHPGLFAILSADPDRESTSKAARAGLDILRGRVRNIALAGRLRISEDRAVDLLTSVAAGTVLTLLGQPPARRDHGLSIAARESVIATIMGEGAEAIDSHPNLAAATLRASLDQTSVLTDGERHLLTELLDRIANGS